jgi:DNA-binding response OmpR family regulator
MEGLSGFELYKELKRYVDVPVIFITAYSDIEHIEEAFGLGASDYIKKPFDFKELELRIKRLLFNNTNCIYVNEDYKFDLKKLKLLNQNLVGIEVLSFLWWDWDTKELLMKNQSMIMMLKINNS